MIIIIITAFVLCLCLGIFSIFAGRLTLSKKSALICKKALLFSSLGGFFASALTFIIYIILPSGNSAFPKESFAVLSSRLCIVFSVCFFVTILAYLLKSKLSSFILPLTTMWAVILLFITAISGYMLSFTDKGASVCCCIFGAGLSLFLFFPSYLEVKKRADVLCDKEKRDALIASKRENKLKREIAKSKRKSLREKKKRLRHPKKQ